MSLRYKQLGIPEGFVNVENRVRFSAVEQEELAQERGSNLYSVGITESLLATVYYLHDRDEDARSTGQKATALLHEYFVSDWRLRELTDEQTIDPAWWHQEPWMEGFTWLLAWGSALGEWALLEEVATYPDETRSLKFEFTAKRRALLEGFARHLRGAGVEGLSRHVAECEGRGADDVLLAEALESLSAENLDLLQEKLVATLKVEAKRKHTSVLQWLSPLVTFLVHLAKRRGAEVTIDPPLGLRVIRAL